VTVLMLYAFGEVWLICVCETDSMPAIHGAGKLTYCSCFTCERLYCISVTIRLERLVSKRVCIPAVYSVTYLNRLRVSAKRYNTVVTRTVIL
jgi:hypothetical protein